MLLFKHNVMGTYIDTYHTSRTRILIDNKDPIFKLNSIFRAIVGTHAALVAKVDAVIAWSRKAPFNAQQ